MSLNQEHWFHMANPLLRHLPNWSSVGEMAEALGNDPLAGLNVAALSPMEKYELLMGDKMPLLPTTRSLKCGMTIASVHRCSLRVRNTAIAEGRRRVEQTIQAAASGFDFLKVPPAPGASLLVMKGMSGTSKSVTAKLTLPRLLGPQVIQHGEEPPSLFKSATQLNWLYVSMSHDGSRSGLLTGILIAIDTALKTTFATDLRKGAYRTIESLAGAVIALLHSYYTGVVVIDEIQLLNLIESQHAELMQLFLLCLANSGIPLVLIGNPFGFEWLSKLSQNLTRLVERPQFFFHPCGAMDVGDAEDEDEWSSVSAGVMRYYVLDEPVVDANECRLTLKRCSGGIARLALSLWCNAQADALFAGRQSLCAHDIQAVYDGESFERAKPLVDGFSKREPTLLLPWRHVDIPVDLYARHWGKSFAVPQRAYEFVEPSEPVSLAPKTGGPRSAAAKLKSAETRERNRQLEREKLASSLQPEDMRKEGLKQHGLDSLDQLMQQIQRGNPRPPTAQA